VANWFGRRLDLRRENGGGGAGPVAGLVGALLPFALGTACSPSGIVAMIVGVLQVIKGGQQL
jgi:hypothetical protein